MYLFFLIFFSVLSESTIMVPVPILLSTPSSPLLGGESDKEVVEAQRLSQSFAIGCAFVHHGALPRA